MIRWCLGAVAWAAGVLAPPVFGAVTFSPESLDFGPQLLTTYSAPKTVTFSNSGPGAVSLSLGFQPPSYEVTHDCANLAAGATCRASIRFHPTVAGAWNQSMRMDASPGFANYSVPLKGVGEFSLVSHYYRSILRREPDAGGHAFWNAEARRIQSLGANGNEVWYAMAMSFFNSAEYRSLNRDGAGFVTDLYRAFFMRAPDPGGLAYWSGQLASGMPREVVLAEFLFSAEFQAFTRRIFDYPPVRPESDASIDFYRGLLSRLPDAAGFLYWRTQFRVAQCQGGDAVSRRMEAISTAFVVAPEYLQRARTNAQFVGDLYNAFLRRGGDLDGVRFWIAELERGRSRDSLRRDFLASPEFAARVQAMLAAGCSTLQEVLEEIPAGGGSMTLADGSTFSMAAPRGSGTTTLRLLWPADPYLEDYYYAMALLDAGPPGRFYDLTTNFYSTIGDIALSVAVPDDLLAAMPAGYEPAIFGKAYAEGPDGVRDDFVALDSTYDPVTRLATATLPPWACSRSRTGGYPWKCIVALGSLPLPTAQASGEKATEACMPLGLQACSLAGHSPIGGRDAAGTQYTDLFGERPDPKDPEAIQLHKGVDIRAASLPLVPIADGYVSKVICSATYGQQIVIVHDDGVTQTSYSHLVPGSIDLTDSLGRKIAYQLCEGHTAIAPLVRDYPRNSVRVVGGVTVVGFSDTSGRRVTGPHLHMELLKRVGNRRCAVDPRPCINRTAPAAYVPPPPPPNACCVCRFDAACRVYGLGGCWKCVQSTYAPGFVCRYPRGDGLVFDGLCECNPSRYEVCTSGY